MKLLHTRGDCRCVSNVRDQFSGSTTSLSDRHGSTTGGFGVPIQRAYGSTFLSQAKSRGLPDSLARSGHQSYFTFKPGMGAVLIRHIVIPKWTLTLSISQGTIEFSYFDLSLFIRAKDA